jgi:hypothetical protein
MKGRRGSFFNRLFDYLPQEQGMGVISNILDYADGFGLPSAGVMLSHFENVHFGLPDPGSNSGHIWAKQVVSRFMNRLLGLPLPQQQAIFTYFQWLFVQAEAQQRDDGTLDVGVTALAGESELVQDVHGVGTGGTGGAGGSSTDQVGCVAHECIFKCAHNSLCISPPSHTRRFQSCLCSSGFGMQTRNQT